MEVKAFRWTGKELLILDQRKLPSEEEWFVAKTYKDVGFAIKEMLVRGAPAIGCVSAYGFLLGIREREDPLKVADYLKSTRPTAVNLFWAVDRMMKAYREGKDMEEEAILIEKEDYENNKRMGEIGNSLIPEKARILTHCNTGALATAGWGTALGVIRSAHESGKDIFVWVDETRPYLQGARLTAWELMKEGIPHKLVVDSCAGFLMSKGMVDVILVGADRITLGGDVANKIGTYTLSVLAKEHGIPFYVVAPLSTFDINIVSGRDIPIEERSEDEVKGFGMCKSSPEKTRAFNPAFDVTPAGNITAIITERGVIEKPDEEKIRRFLL